LIKKVEHFIGTKLIDVQVRSDYLIENENYSCIDCFINHTSIEWIDLVQEVLNLVRKFSVQWEINLLDTSNNYSGKLDYKIREDIGGYAIDGPSGLRQIQWYLTKDQDYKRLW
jgi:hypothetical protein